MQATANASGLGWRFGHMRAASGEHEIDLVSDLPHGGVVAFEAKLFETVDAVDARQLAGPLD